VLHAFAKQHCQLDAQQIGAIEAAVERAIGQNLPLLERLQQQYGEFAAIAERLHTLLVTPLP
jgi:serine/threonine-protein kinase HipA